MIKGISMILLIDDAEELHRLTDVILQEGFRIREPAAQDEVMLVVAAKELDFEDGGNQAGVAGQAEKALASVISFPKVQSGRKEAVVGKQVHTSHERVNGTYSLREIDPLVASVRKILGEQPPRTQQESQELATPGFVRRAAHECSNLLQAITGNVDLLLKRLPEADPSREVLAAMGRAAWRAAELSQGLLGRMCRLPGPLRLDCGQAVRDTATLLRPLLDESITFEVLTPPGLWSVDADASQVIQILMNLCLNARDAMGKCGNLTLAAANLSLTHAATPSATGPRAGEFVRFRVADTGHGIPANILPRIYDQDFTTKDTDRGNGVGLAVVREFVEQHHGWIECATELTRGTSFDIFLPRAADEGLPVEPLQSASVG